MTDPRLDGERGRSSTKKEKRGVVKVLLEEKEKHTYLIMEGWAVVVDRERADENRTSL